MAIDELLTDNDFWSAYKDPKLGKLFEPYLIQHKAHPSQKGQSGYDPNSSQWYAKAKKDPKIIEAIKNLKAKQSKASSLGSLFNLTQQQSAVGLAVIILSLLALYSMGVPYTPPPLY